MIKTVAVIFIVFQFGIAQNISMITRLQTNLFTLAPITINRPCGRNEVWKQCSSTCPETCDGRPTTPCILICRSGCDCLPDYVRHDGQCIRRNQCPQNQRKHFFPLCVWLKLQIGTLEQ